MQTNTNIPRHTPIIEHEIISPVPIKTYEENNCYSGSCLSGFRPFDNGQYHSPIIFSGKPFLGYYSPVHQFELYKDNTDML